MTAPLVSVVIPAFNAEEYVETAVHSALGQTVHEIEVVVVDDGSTDATAARVGAIDDPRLVLLRRANAGQSVAINSGVVNSQGAYIKLLDADDWLNPEHIESQLSVLDGSEGVVASCAWGPFVNDFADPVRKHEHTNRNYDEALDWIVDSLVEDTGMMGGWMWLIPRALWNRSGGYEPRLSFSPNNDFEFSIRLLLASSGVRFASGAVYSYRKGVSAALSAQRSHAAMASILEATEMGTALLLEAENSPRIRRLCANRIQKWLFQFYPDYPGLVEAAERRIEELGGSDLQMQGGMVGRMMTPLIGWKGVRRLQRFAYSHGWRRVLGAKAKGRLRSLR
jgi:glycosyltransferase involved in cell wall biosynthesis